MQLFGIGKKKEVTQDVYNQRNHPNAYLRDDAAKAAIKSLIIDLAVKTKQLTAKDIKRWRTAWQIAINVENPKRNQLYLIYDDALIDLHLTGATEIRKAETMAMSFKVVDKNNNEKPEITELLEATWFKDFLELSLESRLYGHSLIQFGDRITEPKLSFKEIKLVPREHVIPEHSVFVKDAADDWKKGIDYTRPPYSNWCMPIGKPNDLGLLLKLAPHAISKKNMLAFWDKFGELFGMPIRIAKTSSRESGERTRIEGMLEDMGSAAWGVFPEGTEIEIKESARGDAFNVYDRRIERANSEMSKGILGVTMTMDNGSSQSQSEVHERVQENIFWRDKDFIRDVVNNQLFPFLLIHGFPLKDLRFDWNETQEYTPEQQLKIDQFLVEHFDIDNSYYEEKYNVKIKGNKNSQPLPGKQVDFF
jgi:hypothetical protein